MGALNYILKRSELHISESPQNLRYTELRKWCEQNDIAYDPETMTGTWEGKSNTVNYAWEFENVENTNYGILHQETCCSSIILGYVLQQILPTLAILCALYSVQRFGVEQILNDLIGLIAAVVLAGFIIIIFLPFSLYFLYKTYGLETAPNPLIEGRDRGLDYYEFEPMEIRSYFGNIEYTLIFVAVFLNNKIITGSIIAFVFLFNILFLIVSFINKGDGIANFQQNTIYRHLRLSSVPKKYLGAVNKLNIILLLAGSITLTVKFIASNYAGMQLSWLDNELYVSFPYIDPLIAVIILYVWGRFLLNLSDDELVLSYYNFHNSGYSTISKVVDAGGVILSSLVVYAGLLVTIDLFGGFNIIHTVDYYYGVKTAIGAVALLSLYIPSGIAYQVWDEIRKTKKKLDNATKDHVDIGDYQQEYYLLDSDDLIAESFTVLFNDYIIVSRGYRDVLSDRQFAAVVAHEAGHIEHKDTHLCLGILCVSVVLLVGKNVLYSLVNFQAREDRADDYAATMVGKKPLIEALEEIKRVEDQQTQRRYYHSFGPNMSPQFDLTESSHVRNLFSLFFGGFALEDAHDSLEQRTDRL